jgi:hypothetical protein
MVARLFEVGEHYNIRDYKFRSAYPLRASAFAPRFFGVVLLFIFLLLLPYYLS